MAQPHAHANENRDHADAELFGFEDSSLKDRPGCVFNWLTLYQATGGECPPRVEHPHRTVGQMLITQPPITKLRVCAFAYNTSARHEEDDPLRMPALVNPEGIRVQDLVAFARSIGMEPEFRDTPGIYADLHFDGVDHWKTIPRPDSTATGQMVLGLQKLAMLGKRRRLRKALRKLLVDEYGEDAFREY